MDYMSTQPPTMTDQSTDTSNPWDDYDHDWDDETIERYAETFDQDVEELHDRFRRKAWLDDASLEDVLEAECEQFVELNHDTRLDHNVHVVTSFEAMPSDIVLEHGFDGTVDWLFDCRHAIRDHTEYRITNTRLVDGQLTLTLAPEDDQ